MIGHSWINTPRTGSLRTVSDWSDRLQNFRTFMNSLCVDRYLTQRWVWSSRFLTLRWVWSSQSRDSLHFFLQWYCHGVNSLNNDNLLVIWRVDTAVDASNKYRNKNSRGPTQRIPLICYCTFNQQGLQVWGEGWVAMKAFQEDIFGPGLALRLLARDKG